MNTKCLYFFFHQIHQTGRIKHPSGPILDNGPYVWHPWSRFIMSNYNRVIICESDYSTAAWCLFKLKISSLTAALYTKNKMFLELKKKNPNIFTIFITLELVSVKSTLYPVATVHCSLCKGKPLLSSQLIQHAVACHIFFQTQYRVSYFFPNPFSSLCTIYIWKPFSCQRVNVSTV